MNENNNTWRKGDVWLYSDDAELRFEWNFFTKFCGTTFKVRQDDGVGFSVAIHIPLIVSLYFTILEFSVAREIALFLLKGVEYDDRNISIHIHDGGVYWKLWRSSHHWDTSVPFWREGVFNYINFVLGAPKSSSISLSEENYSFYIQNEIHNAQVIMKQCSWERKRWFTKTFIYYTIEVEDEASISSKGNGHCRLLSHIFKAETKEAVLEKFREYVLHQKSKHE